MTTATKKWNEETVNTLMGIVGVAVGGRSQIRVFHGKQSTGQESMA